MFSAVLTVPHDAFAQTTNETVTVSEIAISGNSRVSDSTISAYLPVRVGDAISEDSLDNAIDSLFATKLFNDVTINIEGTRISIAVVENPIVNRVNIEGNDVLDDERLLAELDIQPRRVFTRKVAVDATQKLLEIYPNQKEGTLDKKLASLVNKKKCLEKTVSKSGLSFVKKKSNVSIKLL